MCKVLRHPVSVASEVDRGSLFKIVVPLGKVAVAEAVATVPTPTPQQPLAGMRVLAVDNEKTIVEGLTLLLAGWKVDVVSATSAADAIRVIDTQGGAIDAILADYHIHREDGIALVQALRARVGRNIPAVLITADRSKSVQDDAANADMQYLRKPVKPASLRASLSQIRVRQQAAE